jgi:GNAT superfamily N-acetyltransferase
MFYSENDRPRKFFSRLKEHRRSASLFSFTIFPPGSGRPGLYLEDLFVKPEKRGKGYGRALLVDLAKIARDRGCGRMEWAVLDWNEPAIKFYRALGAKPMDEWTVFRLTRDGIARLAQSGSTLPRIV